MSNQKPTAPLSQDEADSLAVYLASEALGRSHEAIEAASALWHAAATVALVHLPRENLLEVLDSIHAITREGIVEATGLGATRQ